MEPKKKILVIGANGIDMLDATSIIMTIFLNYYSKKGKKVDFLTFAAGEENSKEKISDQIECITIKSPYKKSKISFYRALRKLQSIFRFNLGITLWRFYYRKIKKLFKNIALDCVIAASGQFDYAEAAYRFAKKRGLPFFVIYFDSYSLSPFVKKKKSRFSIERRWFNYATKILVDCDSAKLPFEESKDKIAYFCTPIFQYPHRYNPDGDIVFGGIFYPSFRPVNILNEFLNNHGDLEETFAIYSPNKDEIIKKPNIKAFDCIKKTEYSKVCEKAKAIIVIGNGENTTVMPSKFYDALAYKIPLICLNFGPMQEKIEKLPLCFSGYDPSCLEKINQVSPEFLEKVNLSSIFPERNPKVLESLFDDIFVKQE